MLSDGNLVPSLLHKNAASAKRKKTTHPPVAKKPVGLMERITTERKTSSDQSG